MTNTLTAALKPCPFCGGTNLYAYRNIVECRNPECGGSGPDVGDTQLTDAAKDAWNARASLPSPPVSGEAVALYQLELENGEIEHLSGCFAGVSEIDGIRVVKSTPLFASPLTNEPVVWGKVDADTGPNLSDQLAAIDAEPIVPVRDKPIRRFAGNEPVGVTVSFEDAALIVRALDEWEPGLANEEGAALRLMKELGGRNV